MRDDGDGATRRDGIGDRVRRRTPAWVKDVGVALLVLAAVSVPWVIPRDPRLEPATLAAYLLTALTVVPLVWRRRAPVGVLSAVLAAQVLYGTAVDGPGQALPYTGLVALYTVAALAPSPRRQAAGALVLAVVCVSVELRGIDGRTYEEQVRELVFSLLVFVAAYAMGRLSRIRQDYTRAVEERAAQLERTRQAEAEQAAARERARIAREMHDILSHAVSIMIVQAEAGPVAVRAAPERAEAAFDAISETGREAMTQLRRLLGVLRADLPGPRPVSRAPQPSLAELPALVERVAAGGLRVSYGTSGVPLPLPLDAEATVYRVVQEALTNVVKHAGASSAAVRLTWAAASLAVSVTDDGRGPRTHRHSTTAGHGLTGVAERAAAHGGTSRAGPGPGGRGFELRVELPLVGSVPEVGV